MAYSSTDLVYSIDGRELPTYPTSVVASHNLVSKSWNNMYGEFQDIPVNSKLKINWVFDCINIEDASKIFSEMILSKILQDHSRFFEINSYFPGMPFWPAGSQGHGHLDPDAANPFVVGTFYLGTPTNLSSVGGPDTHGQCNWCKMELHWIEVDGERLNSPTDVPTNQSESRSLKNIIVNNKKIEIASPEQLEEELRNTR